jgi:RsiW-degrading membrane proteinase PrsW (M82 family)
VLVIATLMSLAYGIQALVDLCRPKFDDEPHPTIGILGPFIPNGVKATFWCYLSSLGVGLLVAVIGRATVVGALDPVQRARRARTVTLAVAAVLVVPFAMYPLTLLIGHIHYTVVCVPSTAFALWLVYRMQRYRRIPVRMLLAAFAWGALFGSGFGGSMNIWLIDYYRNYAHPATLDIVKAQHDLFSWVTLSAGIFEELGKGAGVAILYILYRRYFDNVVSGIVVGAAVGLGFNLSESVEYMSNGLTAAQQYWFRQSLALMGAHVAFTAVVGAAFGVARQAPDARQRRLVIASGFLLAAAAHFANDVLLRFYGQVKEHWFSPTSAVDILVLQPLLFVVLQGPLVVLYLLLWRAGLKQQRAGLAAALTAEAASGSGAVADDEVDVLLRPERRFYLKMQALFGCGLIGYLGLGRLFAAQLDLGTQRWHRERGDMDEFAPDESVLRERVRRRRTEWQQLAGREVAPA